MKTQTRESIKKLRDERWEMLKEKFPWAEREMDGVQAELDLWVVRSTMLTDEAIAHILDSK